MKDRFLILIALLFWSLLSHAQDSLYHAAELADTLDAVAVTDHAIRRITPVQVMDGKTIERLSEHSVADALRYFSGVQIKDYGGVGGLKTVNVRSLGAQHVGIFYDGVKIHNAQNGQVDLGRYSLDNMEAVSLYNGQKGESLQSAAEYASASSVYLRTRVPVFGDSPYNLKARMKYGSFGTLSPSLRYERRIKGVSLSSELMYLTTRGDYPFTIRNEIEDTTSRRFNGDVHAMRAEAAMFARLLGGDFQSHAYWYKSERGLPGPVVRRLSDQYASTDRQWDENAFLQLSWRRSMRRVGFLLNAKGSLDWLEYLSDPVGNAASKVDNHYFQKDFYGSGAVSWFPARWISFNMAFDERWSDLNCDVKYYNYVQRFDSRAALASNLRIGDFTAQASLLYTYIQDIVKGGSEPLSRMVPALTAGWSGGDITVRGFYKTIFRAPTLNDLYYTLVGNARLKPEYARQLDAGFDYAPQISESYGMKLSADLFYNMVEDKIVAMPVKSQFRWTMMNFGMVKGLGLNASWSHILRLGDTELKATANYSYEEARDVTDPEDDYYGGQIPYTPWHSASVVADATWRKWTACMSWLWTGVRYRASDNFPENRLAPWTTTDLSVSRAFEVRGVESRLGLDVNNILNQQYEVVTRYPMPGINVMFKLTVTI